VVEKGGEKIGVVGILPEVTVMVEVCSTYLFMQRWASFFKTLSKCYKIGYPEITFRRPSMKCRYFHTSNVVVSNFFYVSN